MNSSDSIRRMWQMLVVVAILAALSASPTQARGGAVRSCRLVHGHMVCFVVTGGSGITPPVVTKPVRR